MMKAWRTFLCKIELWLLDVLFPSRVCCLVCGERTGGDMLCGDCRSGLDALRLSGPMCSRCGAETDGGRRCVCHELDSSITAARSVWRYSGSAAALVRRLKLSCVGDAARVLAEGLAEAARSMRLPENTIVTSVAMPPRRKRQRGIDHGAMLAQMTAERLGLPYQQLLIRRNGGHTQRGLSREERLRNLEGCFQAAEQHGAPVLLVDDVLTTGATASVCARALKAGGSGDVYVLTATRA